MAINENSQTGPYDRFGQQIYVGSLAAHYACLSAPPVANGDVGFENQLQIQRGTEPSYAPMPSLHPCRSMPNIAKRNQDSSEPPEESGLALLARNAEAVSSLPTAVTYALATGAAMETLAAVATPAFTHWSSSPIVDGLRAAASDNTANIRNSPGDIESAKPYTVSNGLSGLYFDTTTYTSNPAPQVASNLGLIPTSNVRSNNLPSGYEYNHLANISNGVSHMTLALHNGKGPHTSQTLPNEKCEAVTAHVNVPYTIGFADSNEGAPRFPRAGAQALSSPVDTYSVSSSSSGACYKPHLDLDAMSISRPMQEVRGSRQSQSPSGRIPSNMFMMVNPKLGNPTLGPPQESNSRRTNPPVGIERNGLMSPPALPISRPYTAQATMIRVPTNRPTSAGCGSSVGSPKYTNDSINFTDPGFSRPMKASH
ncbi:hypothetical protein TWF506_000614 [Arthrobotrys conoides]|uniref:Uncharacterized protein n=1 Tax=Arthrobotrys conoides TaxID=74498 RepID=A0AAN8NW63_9PEZI